MELNIGSRLKKAWNAFRNKSYTSTSSDFYYSGSYSRPDRIRLSRGNERSIITAIFNKMSIDVASIDFKHVKLDENQRYKEEINDSLNRCLTLEANIDQISKAFIQDVVMSMFDEGCVAIVPVDYTSDKDKYTDIESLRVGKITEWYPRSVKVKVYNDNTGKYEELLLPKKRVSIIENPLYAVMNEPNSTLQRLMRKLVLLDSVDEQNSSGKLDLIIQLPYSVRSELRKNQAVERKNDIEQQLTGSKYGIAYIDSTEKITQLNRPIENNLLSQIEYLTKLLFSQLGISQDILDGTADEKTMNNYYSRTIEPIVSAIATEMTRKFVNTIDDPKNDESIMFFRDPFKLIPISQVAEIADKFTRNEILSSNEIRQIIGRKPSDDPKADQLINSNLNHPEEQSPGANITGGDENLEPPIQNDENSEPSYTEIGKYVLGFDNPDE